MKKYIKPNTEITNIVFESLLNVISGAAGDSEITGESSGDYSESGGITLGSRHTSVWGDEE